MKQTKSSIVSLAIDILKPDPKNPRTHNDKQITQIARSIKSFGFNVPVLIDENNKVLSGHGRILACKKLGWTEVPTIQIKHLTEVQKKAFAIADNRLTENSVWDDQLLAESFKDLASVDLDFSLETTGFSMDQIDLYIEGTAEQTAPDPDDVPLEPTGGPAISKLGDLWQFGPHRLLCGDATKRADVERVMDGKKAAMTFTDAPYNVNYANNAENKPRGKKRPILNDNLGDKFYGFLLASCRNITSVTNGAIYCCMSSSELHTLQKAFTEAGGKWSTFIVWAKQTFTLGRSDYQRQYEPILYGWPEGVGHHWSGGRNQGDVWFYDKPLKNDLHPTMKPIALVMRAIRNSSKRGDSVLDPFLGSGTTLIAAERTGRVCYGIELDPKYVDTTIRRWQEHTGEQAVLKDTGERFDDLVKKAEVHHD